MFMSLFPLYRCKYWCSVRDGIKQNIKSSLILWILERLTAKDWEFLKILLNIQSDSHDGKTNINSVNKTLTMKQNERNYKNILKY